MTINNFFSFLSSYSSKEKENLIYLYVDSFTKKDTIAKEIIFEGEYFKFKCSGTKLHFEELVNFVFYIPKKLIYDKEIEETLPIEDYLLRHMYDEINNFSNANFNKKKEKRDQFLVYIQKPSEFVIKRNGIYYDEQTQCYVLKLIIQIPLMSGGKKIDGKRAIKSFKTLFSILKNLILSVDIKEIEKKIDLYVSQQMIRKYLLENDYVCFIGNGSILPSISNLLIVPFKSPKENEITIKLKNNRITGMGIKKGISIISGGGYSGKSTLLNAIESGIYNHCLNHNRAFVITDSTALMCNAEDGRYLSHVDLSFFFKHIAGNESLHDYTSCHASGSVSQAGNVLEAIKNESKLLLIDEDRSAVNFMYRDERMKQIIPNEPIITLLERLPALKQKISFIIVIGSLSEFMDYADTIFIMENYTPINKTKQIKQDIHLHDEQSISLTFLPQYYESKLRLFVKQDVIDNKILIYDHFIIDISALTAIKSKHQISYLQYLIKNCLMYIKTNRILLTDLAKQKLSFINHLDCVYQSNIINDNTSMFFESIRLIDLLNALQRIKEEK